MSRMRYSNERMKTTAEVLADATQVPDDQVTLFATADATEPLWCNDCGAPATLACANAGHGCDASNGTLWAEST